jgi:PAS domain S-box-containing protein
MSPTSRIWAWTALLGAAAAGVATVLALQSDDMRVEHLWLYLPLFAVLLAAAERLRVRIRVGDEVDAVNLVEAVLAPMLFAFPGWAVVAVVATGQVLSAVIRRGPVVKNAFNVAQWTLAAGCGALLISPTTDGDLSAGILLHVIGALAIVGVVNNAAFLVVLSLARGRTPWSLVGGMFRLITIAWLGGWALNVLFGLLYVVSFAGHPAVAVLFAVPLVVLHLAYRGIAAVRADQQRLAGLHHAAQTLAAPVDPRDGVGEFLASVAHCFDARAAMLVLRVEGGREVHVHDSSHEPHYRVEDQPDSDGTFEGALSSLPGPLHVQPRDRHPLADLLRDLGWRDCLSAPLIDEGRLTGCLAVLDQDGIEGSASGELAVLEALARETAGTFAKGRLLGDVIDERRKLAEVVGATSDGMLSLAPDGAPLSWNRALEQMTGIPALEALGRVDALLRLQPRTLDGAPVDPARWTSVGMPRELRLTAIDGAVRRLSCSYSRIDDDEGEPRALVVVARDVTSYEQMAALQEEYERLAEEQAQARDVVEQLQQAVVPPAPVVAHSELAVEYVPSDEQAPTGGDLYDWQLLPNGDLHLAVVDVLGHGVSATKAALSVVHTLRVVASDGTPLSEIVGRADSLLSSQDPDLVATAVVARYTPATGVVRIASGGHPPALVLHPDGRVTQVAATGGAIGWPGAGSDDVTELTLDRGDTLLLYTDGLVEARKNLLEGMDELVRYAAEVARLPAAELPAALVQRVLAGAQRRDDTLALVLRRTESVAAEGFFRVVAPDPEAASRARRELGAWLSGLGRRTDDVLLVASELLANAVRAARSEVQVRAVALDDATRLEVRDDGEGDPSLVDLGHELPDDEATAGRGLFLARTLSHGMQIESGEQGSLITCLLRADPKLPEQPAGREAARR